jgi:hypothetical protein
MLLPPVTVASSGLSGLKYTCVLLYSTAQHSTAQHSTEQHSRARQTVSVEGQCVVCVLLVIVALSGLSGLKYTCKTEQHSTAYKFQTTKHPCVLLVTVASSGLSGLKYTCHGTAQHGTARRRVVG